MECLRCGTTLKDNALVCKKCGFIMKGAKKVEGEDRPVMTFEERFENANEEELRAMVLAYKNALEEQKKKDEEEEALENDPERITIRKGKAWSTISFLCGLLAMVVLVVPGVNVIAALILFLIAFMGFGQCAGQRSNLALTGVILSIVAICGSWAYNVYLAPTVGETMGWLAPAVEEGAEVASEIAV